MQLQDRYYYYRPALSVTNIKGWQVYDDKGFIRSREHSDIERMVKECGSPASGGKYNIQAIVNIVVPASFYHLKKNHCLTIQTFAFRVVLMVGKVFISTFDNSQGSLMFKRNTLVRSEKTGILGLCRSIWSGKGKMN